MRRPCQPDAVGADDGRQRLGRFALGQALGGGAGAVAERGIGRHSIDTMTASPPPLVPPLVRALREVREILERARRSGDRREIEMAIERINFALDERRRISR